MNPSAPQPEETRATPFPCRADLAGLGFLAALVLAVYREHLAGTRLFLGNFDRLNSFLNTLLFQVNGWRSGDFSAWDDTMFMGRNTFALPFTYPNAFNRLVALFPQSSFYWVAGYVSIGLLVLAGWAAYVFIQEVVGDRFCAVVGATLYQFSALAVLKVSQNDMSFAVLIQIPVLLWLVRGIRPDRWKGRFAALCVVLFHLLFFCFLQKVAYGLLVLAVYTLYLAVARRSARLLLMVAAAGAVALVAAFPRIYGIAAEMGQLRRQIAPGFDMHNFDALYHWQNFKPVDALRWFHDGLFGRYFGETIALHNSINTTEGMLMFTGTLAPFVVLAGLLRWNGSWLGVFKRSQGEALLFYCVIAAVFAIVVSKQAYHVIFELFLRVDFTHTRIVIAGLPLLCALIASKLAQLKPAATPASRVPFWAAATAALAGILVQLGLERWAAHSAMEGPVLLTDSWHDLFALLFGASKRILGFDGVTGVPHGQVLIQLQPAALNEVLLSAVLALVLFGLHRVAEKSPRFSEWIFLTFGFVLMAGAWRYANFQVTGPQVHTVRPFADSNSYAAAPDEFHLPSADQLARLHDRLQTDRFRTLIYASVDELPLFTEPHIGAAWQLRQVAGYSSGVPTRLAALPWPQAAIGLRTLTFGGFGLTGPPLPWSLLAFLNVKYALKATQALYKNRVGTGELSPKGPGVPLVVSENPLPVAPRVFFAEQAVTVQTMQDACARVEIAQGAGGTGFIDPVKESVVESSIALPPIGGGGSASSHFRGDTIEIDISPSGKARLLVLNELYHPDWHAFEGRQRLPLYPANVVMRAVLVPPEASHVTLRFEPFCRARNVAMFALLAIVLGLVAYRLLDRAFPMNESQGRRP